MWIILEGVDGSGKSTLCDIIAESIPDIPDVIRTHLGAPKSAASALIECTDDEPFGTYRPGGGAHIISDRHHWGCPVYGPVLRPERDTDGYGDFNKAGWRYCELFIASRGGRTIYVDVSAETAQERIRHRGDANYDVETLIAITPELLDRYHWLLTEAPTLGLHIVEPSMAELTVLARDIIELGSIHEDEAAPLAHYPDYIGKPQPKKLLVCEPTKDARLDILASFSDDEWADVGFCSSAHTRDSLHELASTLDYPQIVGVGRLPSDADAFVFDMAGRVESARDGAVAI
jgi:thymidylate kinase